MSTFFIENGGDGGCFYLEVDEQGRAQVKSVSEPSQGQAAIDGRSFNINTGTINLTSDSESALAYIKNTGSTPIHISSVGYLLGNSTGGSGDVLVTLLRNPTQGTIVSGANPVDVKINKNFSSPRELSVNAYKGAEGSTLTDGEDAYFSLLPKSANTYLIDTGKIVLEEGASIGVKILPQTGNTNMNVQVFFAAIDYRL